MRITDATRAAVAAHLGLPTGRWEGRHPYWHLARGEELILGSSRLGAPGVKSYADVCLLAESGLFAATVDRWSETGCQCEHLAAHVIAPTTWECFLDTLADVLRRDQRASYGGWCTGFAERVACRIAVELLQPVPGFETLAYPG